MPAAHAGVHKGRNTTMCMAASGCVRNRAGARAGSVRRVRVQTRLSPLPESAKPAVHVHVAAPAWLVLPAGHAVQLVAPDAL